MKGSDELTRIKGVGVKTAGAFAAHGIRTADDLLGFYPRGYEEYTPPVKVCDAVPGAPCALDLIIVGNASAARAGRRTITHFKAADETGQIRLTFFNMPYMKKSLPPGSRHIFRGLLRRTAQGGLFMDHPTVHDPESYGEMTEGLQPRYHQVKGVSEAQLRKILKTVAAAYEDPEDSLPEADREELGLLSRAQAIRGIHFPQSAQEMGRARDRLVFDEFFAFLIGVRRQRSAVKELQDPRPMLPCAETARLIDSLPYALTDDQAKAWKEIESDMTGPLIMNRMLQGDVGSGKTILAFLALLLCAANGRQGALMAPTEVLAAQHMESILELVRAHDLPLRPVLLTGSVTGGARRHIYEQIASGEANVIIGTHALIQEAVNYHDLSLVITDEQHRFGVRQRELLAGKGQTPEVSLLVMSATPIPRSLAMILYGDLNVSIIRQMPSNRLPIKNLAMGQSQRGKALRFMLDRIAEGQQAYIICPSIEESEAMETEDVLSYAESLSAAVPASVRVAALHGKMKPAEKNGIMTVFAAHETDVLVSTTVIEVGINVPNASVILIENAERFGLSQLHQLRGRVGRGAHQSYCIFLYKDEDGAKKPKRLEILEKTNDGFEISEQDLRLRGPGDLFGVRQSGELWFDLADIYEDADLLKRAASYADRVLKEDPDYQVRTGKQIDFRTI